MMSHDCTTNMNMRCRRARRRAPNTTMAVAHWCTNLAATAAFPYLSAPTPPDQGSFTQMVEGVDQQSSSIALDHTGLCSLAHLQAHRAAQPAGPSWVQHPAAVSDPQTQLADASAGCATAEPESLPRPPWDGRKLAQRRQLSDDSWASPCRECPQDALRVELPGSSVATSSGPSWEDVVPAVLAGAALGLGPGAAAVLVMCAVCRDWRDVLLGDQHLLSRLSFRWSASHLGQQQHELLSQPIMRRQQQQQEEVPELQRGRRARREEPPRILHLASKAGNTSAHVALAQLLSAQGLEEEAMRHWRKAAKGGCLEAALRYGIAQYQGSWGVALDAESAYLQLSRAVRQLLGDASPEGDAASAEALRLRAAEADIPSPLLAKALLMLGFLHFDGEGVVLNRPEAVRMFKLAASHGAREAEEALGWIFNTGQYG